MARSESVKIPNSRGTRYSSGGRLQLGGRTEQARGRARRTAPAARTAPRAAEWSDPDRLPGPARRTPRDGPRRRPGTRRSARRSRQSEEGDRDRPQPDARESRRRRAAVGPSRPTIAVSTKPIMVIDRFVSTTGYASSATSRTTSALGHGRVGARHSASRASTLDFGIGHLGNSTTCNALGSANNGRKNAGGRVRSSRPRPPVEPSMYGVQSWRTRDPRMGLLSEPGSKAEQVALEFGSERFRWCSVSSRASSERTVSRSGFDCGKLERDCATRAGACEVRARCPFSPATCCCQLPGWALASGVWSTVAWASWGLPGSATRSAGPRRLAGQGLRALSRSCVRRTRWRRAISIGPRACSIGSEGVADGRARACRGTCCAAR